jgi:hypothetical protein
MRRSSSIALGTMLIAIVLNIRPTAAQECPSPQSLRQGFVVERSERQKTEVHHHDDGLVNTVMRFDGQALLETTQLFGLFDLDRLDRGRRTKLELRSDVRRLFPLKPGQSASAKFSSEQAGQSGNLDVKIDVKNFEDLFIGACKYRVLKIERSESRDTSPPRYAYTEYYSPDLKFVVAKEYRNPDGTTTLIKYDRIYSIKH